MGEKRLPSKGDGKEAIRSCKSKKAGFGGSGAVYVVNNGIKMGRDKDPCTEKTRAPSNKNPYNCLVSSSTAILTAPNTPKWACDSPIGTRWIACNFLAENR